jgi:hypothetical protein
VERSPEFGLLAPVSAIPTEGRGATGCEKNRGLFSYRADYRSGRSQERAISTAGGVPCHAQNAIWIVTRAGVPVMTPWSAHFESYMETYGTSRPTIHYSHEIRYDPFLFPPYRCEDSKCTGCSVRKSCINIFFSRMQDLEASGCCLWSVVDSMP